jgi:hypothetical protein avisC_05717
MFTEVLSMRLIKLAIFVLALTVLTTSIGSMLFGWQLSSLNSSLCMLLLGLLLLRAQNSDPGKQNLPPAGIRMLGAIGLIISTLILAHGLYRSDLLVLLTLPGLGLLGYVLVRSLREWQAREVTASTSSAR